MSTIIGRRKTEHSVLLGKMYKTEEALAIGLIDEAAKDQTEAEAKVDAYLKKMTAISRNFHFLNLFARNLIFLNEKCFIYLFETGENFI